MFAQIGRSFLYLCDPFKKNWIMSKALHNNDKINISVKSHRLLRKLLSENPLLNEIILRSKSVEEAEQEIKEWVKDELRKRPKAYSFYKKKLKGREVFEALRWKDYAAIRILDYINNCGRILEDPNRGGEKIVSNPIKLIWLAARYTAGGAQADFFEDMINLFRQFSGKKKRELPNKEQVEDWMDRWVSGLEPRVIRLREENKERIIRLIIKKIDNGVFKDRNYYFNDGLSQKEKYEKCLEWWNDSLFHLRFAVRTPKMLNEFLGNSLDPDAMKILYKAEKKGIPFFINPYYLTLLNVRIPMFAVGADMAIRQYVMYSENLVKEYGRIMAWEKEDLVEPGKPNAAGWLLPSQHNVHRRYPEVAILIPDTMGRACGGLCSSCQRMYDFQSGHLNFNLDKLKPKETWNEKLDRLLKYYEEDSQLRDILITGGDALMSSDKSLDKILTKVYEMAKRKVEKNKTLPEGKKYAEMLRVRLGTRLPAYLPMRITPELASILKSFKEKSEIIGIKQFVIQTHFQSAMEITPETANAIKLLTSAGWTVTNQLVFTTAGSRRGHSAKLRAELNNIGVINYYTFSVKGFMENSFNFATNGRAVQEEIEEKVIGKIPEAYIDEIQNFPEDPENIVENIDKLKNKADIPFLATDRNVMNLPGVGKSLTFRTIGITRDGRRILEFEYDSTRTHTPVLHDMDSVIIIESKSISEYLKQLDLLGEDSSEYDSLWGYSVGETEPRHPIYDYPEYDFELTDEYTNLGM